MSGPRIVIIANPTAGKGRGEAALRAAEEALRARGADLSVERTAGPGDERPLAEAAAREGADVIAALGGDGSFHEVLNGVLRARGRAPALGVIPVGTGNDYAKMLRVPTDDPIAAARVLLDGAAREVDVGRLEGADAGPEYFCNNVGAAFLAEANAAHEESRFLPGRLSYVIGGLGAFVRFKADLLTVRVGGVSLQGRFMAVHIGLGRFCGGGVCLTPDAVLDDGQFAICLIAERTKLKAMLQWSQIASGKRLDDMTLLRGERVTVEGPLGFLLHADGEVRTVPTGVLVASVLPGRLRVLHAV